MLRSLLIKYSFAAVILQRLLSITAYSQQSNLDQAMEKAKEISSKLDIKLIAESITNSFSSYLESVKGIFSVCVACVLISAIFSILKNNFGKSGEIFEAVSGAVPVLCVFAVIIPCFDKVSQSISGICAYMTASIPALTTLLYASGNTVTASTSGITTSIAVNVVQLITASVVIPITKFCCTLSAVNSICRKTNLSGINSFFKSCALWIIGLSFTIFTGILSLQTALASGADNLALKGIKFTAARLIPIAGSMVSESMKTVIASMGYVKSVTGIGGIVFIIYTLIPPIGVLFCTKLFMLIMSALSKCVSSDGTSSLFDSINSILNILGALLISSGIAFIIILGIFTKTSVSL